MAIHAVISTIHGDRTVEVAQPACRPIRTSIARVDGNRDDATSLQRKSILSFYLIGWAVATAAVG